MAHWRACAAAAAVIGSVAARAIAGVTFYDVFKSDDYEQVSSLAPMFPYTARLDARIFTDGPGQATGGTLTTPGPVVRPMSAGGDQLLYYRDDTFPTTATLEQVYPAGQYAFAINQGTLAPKSGSLNVPAPLYPGAVPYFTAPTFASFSALVPGRAVHVTFNSFSQVAGAGFALTYFTVYNSDTGDVLYANYGNSGEYVRDVVPGSTFEANAHYTFSVDFSSRVSGPGDLDQGSFYNVGFDHVTNVYATSLTSLPGDYNFDGAVDSADYTVWADHFGANFVPADGNGDGIVDAADYTIWADHFGESSPGGVTVPEPSGFAGLLAAAAAVLARKRRMKGGN